MPRRPNASTSELSLIAITRQLGPWYTTHHEALQGVLVGQKKLGERLTECAEALATAISAYSRERREDVEAAEQRRAVVERAQQFVRLVRKGASVALSHREDVDVALRDFGPAAVARRITTLPRAERAVRNALAALTAQREVLGKKIVVEPLIAHGESLLEALRTLTEQETGEQEETLAARRERDLRVEEAHELIELCVAGAELAVLSDDRPLLALDALLDAQLEAESQRRREDDAGETPQDDPTPSPTI